MSVTSIENIPDFVRDLHALIGVHQHPVDQQLGQLGGQRVRIENCLGPVSYTHLDVYKRQPYTKALDVIKAKRPRGIIFTGGPNSAYEDGAPAVSYTHLCR